MHQPSGQTVRLLACCKEENPPVGSRDVRLGFFSLGGRSPGFQHHTWATRLGCPAGSSGLIPAGINERGRLRARRPGSGWLSNGILMAGQEQSK